MFTAITWATYLRAVPTLLFFYYAFLLLKMYFPQIKGSLSSAMNGETVMQYDAPQSGVSEPAKADGNLTPTGAFEHQSTNDYEVIEELVERVKSVLNHASESKMGTDEVSSSFSTILSDYPSLALSTFRPSINEFIANESELSGFPEFRQETVEQLWTKI